MIFPNDLSEFVYYRTYAKWRDEDKRRETWPETVERGMSFLRETGGNEIREGEYASLQEAILNFEVLPSMRLLAMAGDAIRRENTSAYNCFSGNETFLTQEMGEISFRNSPNKVTILNKNGKWVPAYISSFGNQETVEVEFAREKSRKHVRVTPNHNWILIDGSIKTTRQLSYGDQISSMVPPKVEPIDNDDYRLGIIHGLVYGDGTGIYSQKRHRGYQIRLCADAKELLPFFDGFKTSYPASFMGDPVVYLFDDFGKTHALKETPSLEETSDYLLGFFRGWLAADGSINIGGQVSLCTDRKGESYLRSIAPRLGLQVGYISILPRITNYGERNRETLRIDIPRIFLKEEDFIITRKKERFIPSKINRNWKFIGVVHNTNIMEEVFCATVEDTHTFTLSGGLLTGNCAFLPISDVKAFSEILFILMNGTGCGFSVERKFISQLPFVWEADKDMEPLDYLIPDTTEGWAKALEYGIENWYRGNKVKFDYSDIRHAGTRLKTKGGRASGPKPLRDLLEFTRKTIQKAAGRQLKSIEVLDIANKIAEIVVVGGVRRSSEIALTDLDDDDIRLAKSGEFWVNAPHRSMSNNSVCYEEKPSLEDFQKEWQSLANSGTGERGIFSRHTANKMKPKRRTGNIVGTNPCGEILLRSYEYCNLSEVVARSNDTQETLARKVRLATILGTIQSKLTYFPFLRDEWTKNCEEERLLGVSITGIMDCPAFRDSIDTMAFLREVAINTNRVYASRLGINASASITCIKPSGTASLLVDSSSGIHTRHSPWYKRRVRISANDPLCHLLLDSGAPMVPENGQEKETANTWVIEFPIAAPKDAITRHDVDAMAQLKKWSEIKINYTEHNPSATISVAEDEWLGVGKWVYDNWDIIGGLSFLPKSEHIYNLAPFEDISEEEYKQLVKDFPRIPYEKLSAYEHTDHTIVSREYACIAGICELV